MGFDIEFEFDFVETKLTENVQNITLVDRANKLLKEWVLVFAINLLSFTLLYQPIQRVVGT